MEPSVSFLGKSVYNISLEDIEFFFQEEQEETATLEFKSGDVALEDIYREVSAFLNTDGGLLIIGAPKETRISNQNHERSYCKGELTPSKVAKTKDSLAQKIASHIVPAPYGVRIQQIPSKEGSIFLIEVAQSLSPPHQVSEDGRYYLRMDRRTIPASHGFVQALFNKRRIPQLLIEIELEQINASEDTWGVKVINESGIPAKMVFCLVEVFNVQEVEGITDRVEFTRKGEGIEYPYSFLMKDPHLILVTDIQMAISFTVIHTTKKYFLRTTLWTSETDSKTTLWTYNSETKKIEDFDFRELQDERRDSLIKEFGAAENSL